MRECGVEAARGRPEPRARRQPAGWLNSAPPEPDVLIGTHAASPRSFCALTRILTQLNRGEGRHRLARAIFHGQRGELRQRYREGQEDQLGALGLVTNAVILWNTLYTQQAITALRTMGAEVRTDDVVRLSPLGFEHINLHGRYQFTVTEAMARGELRPLRRLTARHGHELDLAVG